MELPWQSLEGVAGAAGVGSLAVLGLFLVADGLHQGVYPTLEFYSKTATWGIVAAIPAVAIVYLLGLLLIGVGELLLDALPVAQAASRYSDIVEVSQNGNEALIQTYLQLYREAQLLAGSAVAFLLLAAGASVDARNLPNMKSIVYAAAAGVIVVAVLVFLLAVVKSRAAHALVGQLSGN